jgi:RNA polymerase primary sigma factor
MDDKEAMRLLAEYLTPREAEILMMRFALGYERKYTLREVANRINFKTAERVRQIEKRALEKIEELNSELYQKLMDIVTKGQ